MIRLIFETDTNGKSNYDIDGGDIRLAILYNDKTVCVCTAGDAPDIIEQNFDYAISQHADILITASRSKGAIPNKIIELSKKCPTQPEWYKKSDEINLPNKLQDTCNEEYAKYLPNRLNEIINN